MSYTVQVLGGSSYTTTAQTSTAIDTSAYGIVGNVGTFTNTVNVYGGGGGGGRYIGTTLIPAKPGQHAVVVTTSNTVTNFINKGCLNGGGGGGGGTVLQLTDPTINAGGAGGGGGGSNGSAGVPFIYGGAGGIGSMGGGGGGGGSAGPGQNGSPGSSTGTGGNGGSGDGDTIPGGVGGAFRENGGVGAGGGGGGAFGGNGGLSNSGGGGAGGGGGGYAGGIYSGGGGSGGGQGGIINDDGGFGIYNQGTIITLTNQQGVNNSPKNIPLYIWGNVPVNYNIFINGNDYGQLFTAPNTTYAKYPVNLGAGGMTFGIDPGSNITLGTSTFLAVLGNIPPTLASQTGTVTLTNGNLVSWSFTSVTDATYNNQIYGSIWDLTTVVTTGPSPIVPCFNKGTKILCFNKETREETYTPIENLKKGDLVKSYKHGYRKIDCFGKGTFINGNEHPNFNMYKMKQTETNGLTEDLMVTGGHGILMDSMPWDTDCMIDDKYIMPVSIYDKFTKIKDTKEYTYYHFTLENNGDNNKRYGVWANGLLTETPSKNQFSSTF